MTEIERYQGTAGTLALAPEAWNLAQRIARTEFVPAALRGKPEAVLGAILAGHEVGVSPMQALAKIHVIDGRPAMAAELMRAIVLREGHDLWIEEQSSTRVIVAGKRKNSDRETRVTWTMDDARRAGLAGRKNWQSYPSAMLLARATAGLCRAIFPDVLAGISYTVEELQDGDVLDVLEAPPEPGSEAARPPAPPQRTARARKAATRGSSAPAETEPPPEPRAAHEEPPLPGEDDETPTAGGDDDVVDAEIVDEGPADDGFPDDYEGPDQDLGARAYSPTQVLAIRAGELGLDRQAKLDVCSSIVGRGIDSTKDLEPAEVKLVLETMAADGFDPVEILEGRVKAHEAAESAPSGPPRRRRAAEAPEAPPAAQGPSRGPVGSWKAEDWRAFLAERGVKVTEVLKEANRLAREADLTAPGNLDELLGHELEAVLVGFVEDLALERGRS